MSTSKESLDIWMVVAIIQPFKLDDVTLALEGLPHFAEMTVSDCRGFGRGKLADEPGDDAYAQRSEGPQLVDFTNKTRIEIAASDREAVDHIVDTVARAAHTGNPGDGKVFVWPLARAVRVRTFHEEHAV